MVSQARAPSLRDKFISIPWLTIGAFIAGCFVIVFFGRHSVYQAPPSAILLSPPQNLRFFTLGYQESMSDVLWLRVIQDIDICEKAGKAQVPVKTAGNPNPKREKCHNGWPFRMLLGITELTPAFRVPYTIGAITLSVIGEDREGATVLFEKGVKQLPNDWPLSYKAAYHYMYEEKNPQRASDLLISAGKNGAPRWVYGLAAKLMSENGRMELAEAVMKEQIENARNEDEKRSFESKLEELRASFKSTAPAK